MKNTLESDNWDLLILPKHGFYNLDIKQVFNFKDLLFMLVKRDIIVNYKQTILGPIWFFIQPIMTTIIYVFVFGNIANISTNGIPQPLFYLSGIVAWNYFSDCFLKTSDTFSQNADIFGKVYFPRIIMPLSSVISNTLKFGIQLILFLVLYFYFNALGGYKFNAQLLIIFLPFLLTIMSVLGLGLGLIFSSMTTKYKDLKFLIQFGVQLLMYATPIIYPLSAIPQKYILFFKINPIAHIIEAFKFSFFGIGNFNIYGLVYATIFSISILIIGILIFNRTEKSFMDTV